MRFIICVWAIVIIDNYYRLVESKVELKDNGYTGVYIVIKDTVKEDAILIDRIKEEFTDASRLLFTATKNRAYFRNITIVVPKKWKKLQEYDKIPAVNVFTEHIRVDRKNKAKGNAPYVRGNMECGKPGWFMHLTPNFLKQTGQTAYGQHENAIVHEWGHLHWGLFDEYPSIPHPKATKPSHKINFYNEDGSWKPVTCSNLTKGGAYRGNCNITKPCNLNSIQLPVSCKFCPDKTQDSGVRSSLMATQWISSMNSFGEEDSDATDPSVRHNSKAPNLQNKICNGQSAWEVMDKHEDFSLGNNPAPKVTLDTTPNFRLVQETGRVRVFVFDVSGSMGGTKIIKQKQAAWLAIDSLVETGSWLGLVSFSGSATKLASLTEIRNNAARNELKTNVPVQAGGGTNIYSGLQMGLKVIEESNSLTQGTEIVLLSDGQSDAYLHIIPELHSKGIIVHTIAISNAADQGMAQLARETGGSSFTYLETESVSFADVIGQAIATGSSDSSSVEKVFGESYNIRNGSSAGGTFIIDEGLGNETTFTVLLATTSLISIYVQIEGPNHTIYTTNETTDMLTFAIDNTIEAGTYTFTITTYSISTIPIDVSVTSKPVSESSDIIHVTSSLSNTTMDFSSLDENKVYASIEKGGSPVLKANVTALLAADQTFTPITIHMFDIGTGADTLANDGVYSAYLLKKYFTVNSRYNIKIQIVGDGNAFTYTTDVDGGARVTSIPGEVDDIEFEEKQLDEFERQSLPGEITVPNFVSSPPDSTPPAPITDLRVENIRNNEEHTGEKSITYTLAWTAVGEDMDVGTAQSYDIRMDPDNRVLYNDFNSSAQPITLDSPKTAGETERVNLTLTLDDCKGTCYVAIKTRDVNELDSDVSNIVNVDVNFAYEPEELILDDVEATTTTMSMSTSTQIEVTKITDPNTTSKKPTTEQLEEKWIWLIIGSVTGSLFGGLIGAIVVACIVRKLPQVATKKEQQANNTQHWSSKFDKDMDSRRNHDQSMSPGRGNIYQEIPERRGIPRINLNKAYEMYPEPNAYKFYR